MELELVLKAVGNSLQLVGEVGKLVDRLRGRVFANGAAAGEAQQKLDELSKSISQIGTLGAIAEAYLDAHEELQRLLSLAERAEQFLRTNLEGARDRRAAAYPGTWQLLQSWFDTLDGSQDWIRKNILDRPDWYDTQDRAQIGMLSAQFSEAYIRARENVRSHQADELLYQLREMTAKLRDADALVRATLYDKILGSLQGLGARR